MERKRLDARKARVRQLSGAALQRPEITDALARAFFNEWARVGYAGLSLERVSQSAGVGKAALYRRWPDKATMASDLLSRAGLAITDVNDQGSLDADIFAVLLAIRRVLRHRGIRRIITDLHAEIERTPALALAIRPFQAARRQRIDVLIDRAVLRGEVAPSIDRVIAADLIGAPLYWRIAVLGARVDRRTVARLAFLIAAALRYDGDASSQSEIRPN